MVSHKLVQAPVQFGDVVHCRILHRCALWFRSYDEYDCNSMLMMRRKATERNKENLYLCMDASALGTSAIVASENLLHAALAVWVVAGEGSGILQHTEADGTLQFAPYCQEGGGND
jgi:hypothetical protein